MTSLCFVDDYTANTTFNICSQHRQSMGSSSGEWKWDKWAKVRRRDRVNLLYLYCVAAYGRNGWEKMKKSSKYYLHIFALSFFSSVKRTKSVHIRRARNDIERWDARKKLESEKYSNNFHPSLLACLHVVDYWHLAFTNGTDVSHNDGDDDEHWHFYANTMESQEQWANVYLAFAIRVDESSSKFHSIDSDTRQFARRDRDNNKLSNIREHRKCSHEKWPYVCFLHFNYSAIFCEIAHAVCVCWCCVSCLVNKIRQHAERMTLSNTRSL